MIKGLFDLDFRMNKIDKNGDPLVQLASLIDWELFRAPIEGMRQGSQPRKSKAGRKPWDAVLMIKIIILQSLYNLSDAQTERQILDRLSFMRFLGLAIGDDVPDEKTIWLFKEQLAEAGLTERLFERFDSFLRDHGFQARQGQIIDASIVSVPKQRNTREENKRIKAGETVEEWGEKKACQKDTEARWVKKNGLNFFGYKNHIQVDAKHKFVRAYEVTDAAVHDSQVFAVLLDEDNTSRTVWADSAYRSEETITSLGESGFREHIQRKGVRNRPLSEREKQGNRRRSRTRSRVEHIFGVQAQKMGNKILRCIGRTRARCRIGLRNLAYNLDRYALLAGVT